MTSTENIAESTLAVLADIRASLQSQAADGRLWSLEDLAWYFSASKDQVRKRVVTARGFPNPVKLPTTDNGGHPRWVPREVKAWAERQR